MNALLDISRELARWYIRRIRYLVVTSVGEGTGLFIWAALLLIGAGLLLRNALQARQTVSGSVDDLLNSAQMPTTDDEYVIPVGLLNSDFMRNDRLASACAAGSRACRRADDILDNTVRFARIITSASGEISTHPAGSNAGPSLRTGSPSKNVVLAAPGSPEAAHPLDSGTSVDKYLALAVGALQLPAASLTTVRDALTEGVEARDFPVIQWTGCPPQSAAISRRDVTWELPGPRCLQSPEDLTALQVPAEIVPSALNAPSAIGNSCARSGGTSDCRILAAIRASYALEAAIRLNHFIVPRTAPPNDAWRLTAAYFISVDSVFRFWRSDFLDPLVDMPTARLWAARKYFVDLLTSRNGYESISTTEPYLDYAGAGIVQTRCRVLALPSMARSDTDTAQSHIGAAKWQIVGVVCADLALRKPAVAKLLSRLRQNPLVRVAVLDVDGTGTSVGDPSHKGPFYDQDFWSLAHSPQWNQQFASNTFHGNAWRSISRIMSNSGTAWYIVPLGRDGDTHHILGITPSGTHAVTVQLELWTAVGFLVCGAFALFTVAGWQSRRVSDVHRNLARLLSLPGAAIEVRRGEDGSEFIVYGNDRTEELLQRAVCRFGEPRGPEIDWWREFDSKSLRLPENQISIGRAVHTHIDREYIDALRKQGIVSTYYVKFRHPRRLHVWDSTTYEIQEKRVQWVRVVAGPVMSPAWTASRRDPRAAVESTFGLLIPVFDESEEGRSLAAAETMEGTPPPPSGPTTTEPPQVRRV